MPSPGRIEDKMAIAIREALWLLQTSENKLLILDVRDKVRRARGILQRAIEEYDRQEDTNQPPHYCTKSPSS